MENLYQTPSAPLLESASEGGFFVTSLSKLVVLFIGTMGVYSLYWFYKQWSSQRSSMTENIWPFARAFFSIFFVHALSRRMNDRLAAQQLDTPRYDDAATWFVVITVVGVVLSRATRYIELPLALSVAVDLFGLLSLFPLIGLQHKANRASQDPEGESNKGYSAANVFCLALGLALWAMLIWAYSQLF